MNTDLENLHFHKNTVRIKTTYQCECDCERSGCPGHKAELHVNNTSGVGRIVLHDQEVWLDRGSAQAIATLLSEISQA